MFRPPVVPLALCLLAGVAFVRATDGQPQVAPPQNSAPAPATGLIIGQVVDATTNQPVGDSVVTLVPNASGSVLSPPAREAASRRVLTDGSGHFIFRGLAKGSYVLVASKPGYVNGSYGKLAPRGAGAPIELGDGERLIDLRILAWRQAVIAGRVTDEAGDPVVGVEVRALKRASVAGRPGFASTIFATESATTDDRGAYRIASLEPGGVYIIAVPSVSTTIPAAMVEEYFRASGNARAEMQGAIFGATNSISSPGSAQNQQIGDQILQVGVRSATPAPPGGNGSLAIYRTVFYGQTSEQSDATTIPLKAGEVRAAVDVQLRAVPSVRVSGRLESAEGPVGTVAVQLLTPASAAVANPAFPVATGVADASGAFTLLGVPPGQYVLRVLKLPQAEARAVTPGVVVQSGGGTASRGGIIDTPSVPAQPTLSALQPVTIPERDVTNLRVMLNHGVRFSGQIVVEGNAQGLPVQRLAPYLESLEWNSAGIPEAMAAADGTFKSFEMPPGVYRLAVPLPTGWIVKSALVAGRDIADLPFELKEPLAGIVITISNRGAKVSGSVRDASGAADPAAAVLVFPADSRLWIDYTAYPRRIRDVRSRRDGTFDLGDLPSGDYFIVAAPQPAMDWRPGFLEAMSKLATRITLAEAEQRSIDLKTAVIR